MNIICFLPYIDGFSVKRSILKEKSRPQKVNVCTIRGYSPFFEIRTIINLPSLFRSKYNSALTLNAFFSKSCFQKCTPHDHSKTNERFDLKLNILIKNMIAFYTNIKLLKKDRPKNVYKSCTDFYNVLYFLFKFIFTYNFFCISLE